MSANLMVHLLRTYHFSFCLIVVVLMKGLLGGAALGVRSLTQKLTSIPSALLHHRSKTADEPEEAVEQTTPPIKTHVIFLVHGWMGNEHEMSYLHRALEEGAKQRRQQSKKSQSEEQEENENENENDESSSTTASSTSKGPAPPNVLVHSVTCNVGKTTDGIIAGGTRVYQEMQSVIDTLLLQVDDNQPISISIVGHSLGGLYARYAISRLLPFNDDTNDNNNLLVRPNVFCTTASPHLGLKQATYIQLPGPLEYLVGKALQPTGEDLFRHTNILQDMTTQSFLEPLAKFRRRIAVANAFGTDFLVPTATAGFLARTKSIHQTLFLSNQNTENDFPISSPNSDCHVVTVQTPRNLEWLEGSWEDQGESMRQELERQLTSSLKRQGSSSSSTDVTPEVMASRLDAVGWIKIFLDVRQHLPGLKNLSLSSEHNRSQDDCWNTTELWCSDDLKQKLAPPDFHIPMGHTVLVANAKNPIYEFINRGGRPIMDDLATTLLNEIFAIDNDNDIDELA